MRKILLYILIKNELETFFQNIMDFFIQI